MRALRGPLAHQTLRAEVACSVAAEKSLTVVAEARGFEPRMGANPNRISSPFTATEAGINRPGITPSAQVRWDAVRRLTIASGARAIPGGPSALAGEARFLLGATPVRMVQERIIADRVILRSGLSQARARRQAGLVDHEVCCAVTAQPDCSSFLPQCRSSYPDPRMRSWRSSRIAWARSAVKILTPARATARTLGSSLADIAS